MCEVNVSQFLHRAGYQLSDETSNEKRGGTQPMDKIVTKMEQLVGGVARGLAGFVTNNPWKALLSAFVLLAVSVPGLRGLTPDPTHRAYFKPSDPLRIQVEEMERRFSNDDSIVLMVHSPSGVFDTETSELLVRLTEEMWRVPDIIRVESLSNYRWVHASGDDIAVESLIPDSGPYTEAVLANRKSVALSHEVVPGYLVSEDANTALVIGFVRPDDKNSAAAPGPIVNGVREMISRHQGGDHEFYITGRMAVMQSFLESTEHDMKSFMPFLLLIIVVTLWLNFRRFGAFTPLIVVIFSVITTMGISGWLGMKVTNITAVVPQFLIAVAVAGTVHILSTYFSLLRNGENRRHAMYRALSENFMPTVMTSVTTAIGFFSFVSSDIIAIGQMGIMVGIGTEIAWVLTYLLLPPVVLLLPSFRKEDKRSDKRPIGEMALQPDVIHAPKLDRYVAALSKFRLPVVLVFFAIAAVSVYVASDI
ncbi:MAG: efflux RND transporter permease subunit, partial [Gammaproteobacteria bacterium]